MTRDGLTVTYPLAYSIGSGSHATGYLMQLDSHLFQAPISYYTKRKSWDMAPGYHGQTVLQKHAQPADNCIGCQMPKRPAKDGAHTAFTDHHISPFPFA